MKRKFYSTFIILTALALAFASCSSNKGGGGVIEEETLDLTLSVNEIALKLNSKQTNPTITILSGNGGYTIVASAGSETLADAKIEGNTITFTPKKIGKNGIFEVSDNRGEKSKIKVSVENDYLLMKIVGFGMIPEIQNHENPGPLVAEALDYMYYSLALHEGDLFELEISDKGKNNIHFYKSVADAFDIGYNPFKTGEFSLDTESPCMTVVYKDKTVEKYQLNDGTAQMMYTYFGVKQNWRNRQNYEHVATYRMTQDVLPIIKDKISVHFTSAIISYSMISVSYKTDSIERE